MKTFESMLHEVATELGLLCETKYEGMHTRFKDVLTGNYIYLIGNYLPLNSNTSCKLATDKALATDILNEVNVSCVQHTFLSEDVMNDLINQDSLDIFIKPIRGTSGRGIHRITSKEELQSFIDVNYPHGYWCYSPTEIYDIEYRLSILDGECLAIYGKTKGENSQNNLSAGATAFEVDIADHRDLLDLALRSVKPLGIRLCNVDLFYDQNGNAKVMEINSGMCFNIVLNASEKLYQQSKEVYRKALLAAINDQRKEAPLLL